MAMTPVKKNVYLDTTIKANDMVRSVSYTFIGDMTWLVVSRPVTTGVGEITGAVRGKLWTPNWNGIGISTENMVW